MRCKTCTTLIPHQAKYCPKCGARAAGDPARPQMAIDAHPPTAPIPRTGKAFIGSAILGLALVGLGLAGRNPALIYAGVAILIIVAFAVVVGHHVS
jgi:hypothetical protein